MELNLLKPAAFTCTSPILKTPAKATAWSCGFPSEIRVLDLPINRRANSFGLSHREIAPQLGVLVALALALCSRAGWQICWAVICGWHVANLAVAAPLFSKSQPSLRMPTKGYPKK